MCLTQEVYKNFPKYYVWPQNLDLADSMLNVKKKMRIQLVGFLLSFCWMNIGGTLIVFSHLSFIRQIDTLGLWPALTHFFPIGIWV